MQVGFHVQCLMDVLNFNQDWNFSKNFTNSLFNFTKILLSEAELLHADW
jgi:hypothetical protein